MLFVPLAVCVACFYEVVVSLNGEMAYMTIPAKLLGNFAIVWLRLKYKSDCRGRDRIGKRLR